MMADGGTDSSVIPWKFHWSCGQGITLSEDRRTADSGRKHSNVYGAFSNDPIPNGLQFSVKILETSPHVFRLGVTTKKPDSVPQPQGLSDLSSWYVVIGNGHCTAWHNGQTKVLPWDLDRSEGNTFGCRVSHKGQFYLYHNGRNVGVAWKGLPIYEQLWGFVGMVGGKVEADYMSTKVSETPSNPSPPIGSVPTGCLRQEVEEEKCKYCPLVFTHEHHLKLCPSYPVECPNECGARGLTRSKITAHQEVCLLQRVECEYKQFGCAIVLPRKDMSEHLKKSVESHLQMTKRRVEEQEVHLQEQKVCLQEQKVHLQEQEVRLQEQEVCLQEQGVRLQEQEVRLQEQEVRLQEQGVRLQEEKDERQLLEVRLNDVKKLESELQEEKSKHQQMEARLLEVVDTLNYLKARLN